MVTVLKLSISTFSSLLLLFGTGAATVSAFSLSLDPPPVEVSPDENFSITVTLECSGCQTSFLRGVFFKDNTTQYSGFTRNNQDEWINDASEKEKYFQVSTQESASWSGSMAFRFDSSKPGGDYRFKIGRYSSSTDSSAQWSQSYPVMVRILQTPTPVPTNTPPPTPTPTPKAISVTSTPTVRPTISPRAIPTLAVSIPPTLLPASNSATPLADESVSGPQLLGTASGVVIPSSPPVFNASPKPISQIVWPPLLLGGGGVLCLIVGGFLFVRPGNE